MPKVKTITSPTSKAKASAGIKKRKTQEFNLDLALNRRFKIIILTVITAFSLVWVNLYSVQIVNQDNYLDKLQNFTKTTVSLPSLRGNIYDRNGEVLVSNRERLSIVYYPPSTITKDEEWTMAQHFVSHFTIDGSTLYSRDLKDLYIFLYPKQAEAKITADEWDQYYDGTLSDSDIYQLKLDRITETETAAFDEATRSAYVVYTLMNAAPTKSIKIIKDNCSIEEVAFLAESSADFPGFDSQVYFDRTYPNGALLSRLLGTVTTSKQGLNSDNLLYNLALGYSRNSVIGKTGLELVYESLLRGQNRTYEVSYDEDGLARFTQLTDGISGQDLYLTVDSVLQARVETTVARWLQEAVKDKNRPYLKNINVVIMDPNNGDILALVSMGYEDGVIVNDVNRVFTQSMSIGSTIKAATVYMGLDQGVIRPGEVIDDAPIKIKETPEKKSYKYLGRLNDLQALAKSSNVYMFHIAMRLGGATYKYDEALNVDIAAFDIMRNYYSQFGLGSLTGVDVPYEATGYKGSATLGGHLLDFAIGQYDTYTVMQLAQYIATIANGGSRLKPRLLLKATEANSTVITYQNDVQVLNVLSNQTALERVQKGLRLCVTGGLCTNYQMVPVPAAAKTGTAETTVLDAKGNLIDSSNSLVVAYAPYAKPEIAVACGVPNAFSNIFSYDNICSKLVSEIMTSYFSGR